jgi:hypothetical protein
MGAPSFRDRLFTRRAARGILSPLGLAAGVVVAAVLIVVGAPVWLGVLAGVAVWAANALRTLPRGPRRERIDPFTVQEPWRRFVQDALQARTRFAAAVDRAPAGPLHDRLREIAARIDTGVDEAWRIARRGQTLVQARRGIDVADLERQATALGPDTDDSTASVMQAIESQRASAARMDAVIERTRTELRVLDARLDETVARTLELTARASTDAGGLAGLGSDVDSLVTEMEALRLALDETDAAAGGTPGAAGPSLPPGGPA